MRPPQGSSRSLWQAMSLLLPPPCLRMAPAWPRTIPQRREHGRSAAPASVPQLHTCAGRWRSKGTGVCRCRSGDWPDAFARFVESVLALKFDEEPRYEAYRALFEPITMDAASAERPIQLLHPPRSPAAPAKACPACMRCCKSQDDASIHVRPCPTRSFGNLLVGAGALSNILPLLQCA